jgi:hypothetical protein
MSRYAYVRFPREAYENIKAKRLRVFERLVYLTNNHRLRPPKLTQMMIAVSKSPIDMPDEFLLDFFYKGRKKK